ncbi:MAG: LPXTG cell wall anchor domain-containing protein [Saccharofermentanales bacterium]
MLKRILGIMMCLSMIFSILVVSSINVSAAAHPTWEIAQNYESGDITGLGGYGMQSGGGDPAFSLVTGEVASVGDKSLQMKTTGFPDGHWSCDVIAKNLPAATIASPSGYFYRIETNAPAGTAALPVIKQMDWGNWATWGSYTADTIYISDKGTVTHAGMSATLPEANFSGYIFVKIIDMTSTKVQDIGFTIGPWGATASWGTSTTIFDNLGFYSVPATSTDADYVALANSLKAEYPVKPDVISSISTGTYNNSVLVTTPVQMKAQVFHASSTYDWSVDNTRIATIDANGLLTPKMKGSVVVKMSNHSNPDLFTSTTVNVCFGYITITCSENGNISDALYGIKYKVRGVPTFTMTDTNFKWSVTSGPATIKDVPLDLALMDSDLANAIDPAAALVAFTGSGKVVIRASYIVDPNVYSEWTFNVIPNISYINRSIIKAQGYTSEGYTAASWKTLQTALSKAITLYDGGAAKTTQTALDASQKSLDAAVTSLIVLGNESAAATPTNSINSTDNPQTGNDSTSAMMLSLVVILLGALIISLRRKVSNN